MAETMALSSTTGLEPPSTPIPTIASPAVSPRTIFPKPSHTDISSSHTSLPSQTPPSQTTQTPSSSTPPSLKTSSTSVGVDAFTGDDLEKNDAIPTIEEISALDDYQVFDKDGKAVAFGNLYKGENVARRILLVFVRHFFCGNCQEYLRTLTSTITPTSLLSLPQPTFIAIIGCGSPTLISMYTTTTSCPYPIYADPSKGLYAALHLGRTLELGPRPSYQRRSTIRGMVESIGQSLKQVKSGKIFQGGDYQQVGGEFLFEPVVWNVKSPGGELGSAFSDGSEKRLGYSQGNGMNGEEQRSIPHKSGEQKHITWCHRMRNTRDHVEIPELKEVLGLDADEEIPKDVGEGGGSRKANPNGKRHQRALVERKGRGRVSVVFDKGTEGESNFNTNGNGNGYENGNGHVGIGEGEGENEKTKGEVEKDLELKLGRKRSVRSRASSEKLMGTPEGVENLKV